MTRTVSTSGFMLYNQPAQATTEGPTQRQTVAGQPSLSVAQGMLQEYGGIAKNIIAPSSTSMAEGLNTAYDWATGWDSAAVPGVNLATETASSGTFGGSNTANAVYGYAGGKLGTELFDGKEYAGLGGSTGAVIGGAAAVGGTAAGTAMGAQFGAYAGPVGALAGAVLGAAIGSLFGGDAEDYRFRSYSGELGEDSALNTDQMAEKKEDWQSIGSGSGAAYDRFVASGNYSSNTSSAYKWLKEGNTFTIGDKWDVNQGDYKRAIDNDYASFDGAFGKYTVGHVDDIPGRTKFAQGWVDSMEKIDAAVASVLTPEQIAASKEGLKGSIQGTADWHNTSGQVYGTDAMIFDRYVAIFELAGRDDLAGQLVTGMDRSISGTAEYIGAGGEGGRQRIIPLLTEILQGESSAQAQTTQSQITRQPPQNQISQNQTPRTNSRRRITISRPEGVINPAMELTYV